jgi:hypothetical protein
MGLLVVIVQPILSFAYKEYFLKGQKLMAWDISVDAKPVQGGQGAL